MVEIVKAASPKVKGLIAINCEGQTRGYDYSATPYLLLADLKRAGFAVRKPPIFHRVGIPGSGGPDWLRNDYEPIICVTRGGRLPWSDNTACGHPPKWAPGGEMSNQTSEGRVNQWGMRMGNDSSSAARKPNGERASNKRPSHRNQWGGTRSNGVHRKSSGEGVERYERPSHVFDDGSTNKPRGKVRGNADRSSPAPDGNLNGYLPPVLANPGNVIDHTYTAAEVAEIILAMGGGESELQRFNVGGGCMGSHLAHENEAPFPLELAAFFVKSFCPPGGVVCDPFIGSGTTAHAAIELGRKVKGCDIRQSQIDLTRRRLATITPELQPLGDL
jgi:hypothetical protein